LSSSEQLPAIAAKRKLEPARLARLVRGELDWIVMKCLEKERGRRYETANGLALEIQRYLADEPVLAGPPGVRYRLGKFVRKHRGPVLAGSIIALLLVVGILGTSLGFLRAERLRQIAEANERAALEEKAKADEASAAESRAKQNERQERRKAEASRRQAMEALRATTDDVVEQLIGARPALGPVGRAFLESTLKRWQAFAAERGTSEQARDVRAEGTFRVAILRARLGDRDAGLAGLREARALMEKLAADFPAVPEYRRALADSLASQAELFRDLGKLAQAEATQRQERRLRQKLADDFPAVPGYRYALAASHTNVGTLLHDQGGQYAEAEAEHRKALGIFKKLVADFPTQSDYQEGLATGHTNLGNALKEQGRLAEAEAAYRQALGVYKKLGEDQRGEIKYRIYLAVCQVNLGRLLGAKQQPEEALQWESRGIAHLERVLRQAKDDATARLFLGKAHMNRALTHKGLKRYAEAAADCDKAIELLPERERPKVRMLRAQCRVRMGQVDAALKESEELARSADADTLYEIACVFAAAADRREEAAAAATSKEKCAGRAIELLRQAIAKGWKKPALMKKDDDLKAVRGRDDFKKLLAELEKAR
jgi:tetratricopeptide (TPR) repeat protein